METDDYEAAITDFSNIDNSDDRCVVFKKSHDHNLKRDQYVLKFDDVG